MSTFNFSEFIKECTQDFTPVIDASFTNKDFAHIDLSDVSKELKEIKIPSSGILQEKIHDYLAKRKKKVAFGGYDEKRNLYQRSVIFNDDKAEVSRDIHIGIDLWCDAGTAVIAPLDGTVHSFKDNEGFGNYGPTIILEHFIDERTFYTLYGHLTRQCIKNLAFGQIVEAGDKIGNLGSHKVNGDYAPHLHFQIIEDLQGNIGDYPGVVSKEDRPFYLKNCPDPNLLLKIK